MSVEQVHPCPISIEISRNPILLEASFGQSHPTKPLSKINGAPFGYGERLSPAPVKKLIPRTKSRKSREIANLASGWGLVVIFTVNIIERFAQKLRRIILLHFGRITFRMHVGKIREALIFMVFGLWDVPMTPKPILCIFGDTKTFRTIQETYNIILGKY